MFKEMANEFLYISNQIYKDKKKKFKLKIRGEVSILLYILKNEKTETITPGILSNDLNITSARVAALLNSLEKKELIKREIDLLDRRKIIISLTNLGKNEALKSSSLRLNIISNIFKEFGEEDSKHILRLTNKLKDILAKTNMEVS